MQSTPCQNFFSQIFPQSPSGLVSLAGFTLISCSGKDSEAFLQGQLTCNIKEVTQEQAQFGAYCNQKGRILALIVVIWQENGYLLLLPSLLKDQVCQELKKYILFSKVVLQEVSLICLGLINNRGEDLFKDPELPKPLTPYACTLKQGLVCIKLPGILERYLFIADPEEASQLERNIIPKISFITWKAIEILSGIPSIYPETLAKFTPHQLNLQNLGGVSFNKGCYRGQEIIARMQYLGKLKQKMFILSIQSANHLVPGEIFFDQNKKPVGELVSAIDIDEISLALAVLPNNISSADIFLENQNAVIHFLSD